MYLSSAKAFCGDHITIVIAIIIAIIIIIIIIIVDMLLSSSIDSKFSPTCMVPTFACSFTFAMLVGVLVYGNVFMFCGYLV